MLGSIHLITNTAVKQMLQSPQALFFAVLILLPLHILRRTALLKDPIGALLYFCGLLLVTWTTFLAFWTCALPRLQAKGQLFVESLPEFTADSSQASWKSSPVLLAAFALPLSYASQSPLPVKRKEPDQPLSAIDGWKCGQLVCGSARVVR